MKGILEALNDYIDKHFEYQYCYRQANKEDHASSLSAFLCFNERKAMEEAWDRLEELILGSGDERI